MIARTHATGGFLASALVYQSWFNDAALAEPKMMLLFASGVIGSLVADIDHPKSFVGRRIPLLSEFLKKNVGHRTLTHSLLSLVILMIVPIVGFFLNMPYLLFIGIGLCVGHLSHLVLDFITIQGIAFLYPSKRRYKIGIFQTSSNTELVFNCALAIWSAHLISK